ncbi:Golgi phosphoenolpyruvate transmembrane transporter Pet2 [Schizosaccharomyces osmophilus]|uniref:Golgi phosphoenolpyruvate transmembrane transporter Pet2 n=1 Tax=Schizosaccharomyces osmophilus TaxID=2545709 RepID=A0AAE9W7B1_9SCHI|nr:Golgi phosphoenolpyruvate transmembrane transporter Pet2 [Schizosaccharomyces osmophilus]WBW71159.1 Golgi phosphoenolpyruvate transmembrane transporter Pet2 [Schizosaccharomyces osmophilus]
MSVPEKIEQVLFHEKIGFIFLCLLWYLCSAVTNTSSKSIFNDVSCPVTLTFLQFGFVAFFSAVCLLIRRFFGNGSGIQRPSKLVLSTTLPLSVFQIGGHVFGSLATTRIPVSTVHTVKALSPLFTVLAYRFLFQHSYSSTAYFSLVPLTLGVTLACSFELSADLCGLFYALISTFIFVSQNIFGKKIFTEAKKHGNASKKSHYNKLNLLLYSSGMAFLVMIPVWLHQEGFEYLPVIGSPVFFNVFHNGLSHFFQNILAFTLLSIISPVAYSIASLIKRIFVIVVSILWFRQPTSLTQAMGIALTAVGLYLYDRSKKLSPLDTKKVKLFEEKALGLESQPSSRVSSEVFSGTSSPLSEKNLSHRFPRLDSVVPLISNSPITPTSLSAKEPTSAPLHSPFRSLSMEPNRSENSSLEDDSSYPAKLPSYTPPPGVFKAPRPERPWTAEALPALRI